jgi:hypothetical protein
MGLLVSVLTFQFFQHQLHHQTYFYNQAQTRQPEVRVDQWQDQLPLVQQKLFQLSHYACGRKQACFHLMLVKLAQLVALSEAVTVRQILYSQLTP